MKTLLPLLHLGGRVLLALVFLLAGGLHMAGFAGARATLSQNGLVLPGVWLALLIALDWVGGLALLVGFQTRLGVALLIAALGLDFGMGWFGSPPLGTTYWAAKLLDSPLAILPGLLVLAGVGPGHWAIDELPQHEPTGYGDSNVLG